MYMRNYSMEQSRYWMWSRRKLAGMSHLPGLVGAEEGGGGVAYHDSWEEQAFAEDAAGGLEGCVWPPRSYSCSFCRREFRSAQALGGHMNVHRRDRARLKLSSAVGRIDSSHHPDHLQQQQQQHHLRSPSISCPPMAPMPHQRLAHVCTQVYGENPKPGALSGFLPGPSLSPSRVSAASTPENPNERLFLLSPSFSASSISATTNEKNDTHPYTFLSLSDHQLSLSIRRTIPELKLGSGDQKDMKILQLGEKRIPEKVEEFPSFKRRRIDVDSSRGSSSQGEGTPHDQSALLGHGLSPIRELDLELRLGDPPKVTIK